MFCQDVLIGFNLFLKMFGRARPALIGSVLWIILMGAVSPKPAYDERHRPKRDAPRRINN